MEQHKTSKRQNKKSVSAPVVTESKWTYSDWYEKNKEALSQRRKKRYHNDKEYRDKVLGQNKDYRTKKSAEKPVKARVRVPKHRKPVVVSVEINGATQEVEMFHVGAFARAIGKSVITVHQWERTGLLPRTPFLLGAGKQERLYTAEMVGVVRDALSTRGSSILVSDSAFTKEILAGWAALGIVIGDE